MTEKHLSTILSNTQLTISSREIAEITGKRHDHVMVDCKKLYDYYLTIYSPEKSGELLKSTTYKDSTGRALPCFELSHDASLDLVTSSTSQMIRTTARVTSAEERNSKEKSLSSKSEDRF